MSEPDSTPIRRKRMRRWEVPNDIRFITFSCYQRLPLLGTHALRDAFVDSLSKTRKAHPFQLFAWVVMPEHVHLLVRPVGGTLDHPLKSLKQSVSQRVIMRWKKLDAPVLRRIMTNQNAPRFWQKGGGFDHNIRDTSAFMHKVQYIHRNPVKRELVERPDQWAWSSLRWWMGQRDNEIACDPPPGDPRSWASWKGYM